ARGAGGGWGRGGGGAGSRTTAAGRPRPRNHFETELRMDISYLQCEEGTRRARGNNARVVGAPAAPGSGRGGDVAGHAPRPLSRQGTRGSREGRFDQGKTSGGRSSMNRLPDCVSSPATGWPARLHELRGAAPDPARGRAR